MRILIDARKLGHGGIGTYLSNLISELVESSESRPTLITVPNADIGPWKNHVETIEDDSRPYSIGELFRMSRRIPWHKFDVFHEPHFTLPHFIPIPTVMTIHDLIHINQPERWFYPLLAGPIIRSSLRRATKIIAVSDATASDLRKFAREDPAIVNKITVIPNSYDPRVNRPKAPRDFVSKRFNIEQPYFLSVCSLAKPHKGALALLKGFRQFKERAGAVADGFRLVIAGQGAEIAKERLAALGQVVHSDDVVFVGGLSTDELRYLYAGAEALVVSSTAEGFCLPVLEAQSVETPVISTPLPAVRNLLTPRDLMLSDFGAGAIADGLQEFIGLSSVRRDLAFDYSIHLKRFSRPVVTEEILNMYRGVLGAAQ